MKKTFLTAVWATAVLSCMGRGEENLPAVKETPKLTSGAGSWSADQGQMNWNAAKVKCAGAGMRLPAPAELQSAVSSGNAKDWIKEGFAYWADEEASKDDAAVVDIHFGRIYSFRKRNRFVNVRCRL